MGTAISRMWRWHATLSPMTSRCDFYVSTALHLSHLSHVCLMFVSQMRQVQSVEGVRVRRGWMAKSHFFLPLCTFLCEIPFVSYLSYESFISWEIEERERNNFPLFPIFPTSFIFSWEIGRNGEKEFPIINLSYCVRLSTRFLRVTTIYPQKSGANIVLRIFLYLLTLTLILVTNC